MSFIGWKFYQNYGVNVGLTDGGAYILLTEPDVKDWIAKGNTPLPADQPTLAQVQAAAYAAIDQQAGVTRLKYITDVAGQSETYLLKASDAAAYKAATYPAANIANYPLVQAEAKAISGTTPTVAQYQAAADSILATQAQWILLSAAIEQQRRAGKIAVTAATTVDAVQAAKQATITALSAL